MNKIELNTARNCLRYIVKAFKIKEIYIPYYLCPAIRIALSKEKTKVRFYHINKVFYPAQTFPKNAFILYPNYFGICSDIVNELEKQYENLIVDNAHSFYSEPKGIASFNSLRKFFPQLRNGAFLYTKKTCNIKFEKDTNIYNPEIADFEELCKNENALDYEDIKIISDCTKKYFSEIDINKQKEERIKHFNYWHTKLKDRNRLKINLNTQIPFAYPFLAESSEEAESLVSILTKNGKQVFRYWNNMPENYEEKVFYTNLVVIS